MIPEIARRLTVGQQVFCTVRGPFLGWQTVTDLRDRDGYLRIAGYYAWCPPHNFTLADPRAPLAEAPTEDHRVYTSRHAAED